MESPGHASDASFTDAPFGVGIGIGIGIEAPHARFIDTDTDADPDADKTLESSNLGFSDNPRSRATPVTPAMQ